MITAVLDANVLASGIVGFTTERSAPGALLRSWQHSRFLLVLSEELIEETRRTLRTPYFVTQVSAQRSSRLLALLRYRSLLTPIRVRVEGVATHPEDDLVLAAAVSAKAHYLVTGDQKLQALGSYRGVTIVSPASFLSTLQHDQEEDL